MVHMVYMCKYVSLVTLCGQRAPASLSGSLPLDHFAPKLDQKALNHMRQNKNTKLASTSSATETAEQHSGKD